MTYYVNLTDADGNLIARYEVRGDGRELAAFIDGDYEGDVASVLKHDIAATESQK